MQIFVVILSFRSFLLDQKEPKNHEKINPAAIALTHATATVAHPRAIFSSTAPA
jgi:hypothetical protein